MTLYRMLGAHQGPGSHHVLFLNPTLPSGQALIEHIADHPYQNGKVMPRKGIIAASAMCRAFTVLGINKFEGVISLEGIQALDKDLQGFLSLGKPYYPLEP